MSIERRRHDRIAPRELIATLTLQDPTTHKEVVMRGDVLNLSYSGIRMRLFSAIPPNLTESDIKIAMTLPDSGIDLEINGHIRHMPTVEECGLEYADTQNESDFDGFLFECVKIAEEPVAVSH